MGNEAFLISAYFVTGLASAGLALIVCLRLWKPFGGILSGTDRQSLANSWKRSFPIGTILLGLAAFLSVNYYEGCNGRRTYQVIVADRQWIVQKVQEQLSKTLDWLLVAVFLWALIAFLLLVVRKRLAPGSSTDSGAGNPRGTASLP